MVPSQFLSIVLEEDNCSGSEEDSAPQYPQHVAWQNQYTVRNNKSISDQEMWNLTKNLPKALLAECTVEISRSPPSGNDRPRKPCFDAKVSPIYNKPSPMLVPSVRISESLQQFLPPPPQLVPRTDWRRMEEGVMEERMDVEDLLSGVEAVYSDHESDADNEENASVSIFPVMVHKPEKPKPEKVKKPQDVNKFSYPCEHCPNVYSNRGALWQHSVATHSVEKTCECKICGRKFYRNCSLALHMKSHSEEEYCQCKECGKSFNRMSNLERHMKVAHVDAELFPCPSCDKVFRDKTNLTRHIATHTNPVKYQCDVCNKNFKSQEHLTVHFQTVHLTSESLSCAICGDSFTNMVELMQHDAMHAMDKPQACRFCGMTFTDVNVLRKHIMSHTGEQLTCKSCGIVFSQRSSLLRHIRKMHPNEPDIIDPSLFLDDGNGMDILEESENGSSTQDMTDQEDGFENETDVNSTSEIRKALGTPIKSGGLSLVDQARVNTKLNGLGVSLLKPKPQSLEVSLIPIAVNNHPSQEKPNFATKSTNGIPVNKIVIGGVTITAEKTNGNSHINGVKDSLEIIGNGSNGFEESETEDSDQVKSDNEESSHSLVDRTPTSTVQEV